MLRHNIIRHKPRVNPLNNNSGRASNAGVGEIQPSPQSLAANQPNTSHRLGKYAYALFTQEIEKRGIVIGSYVFLTGTLYPYRKEDVWKVKDIQQIHYMCEYDDVNKIPLPLLVVNQAGETKWASPNGMWKNYMPDMEW